MPITCGRHRFLPDIAARVSLHVAHDEPPNNISGKTKLDSARWRGMGQSTNYAKNDVNELPSMQQHRRGRGRIIIPALVHLNDSVVNWACISPYDSHPPLAGVPDINTHNHGGMETVGRRAGSCGRTCTYIVGSVSSAPSWCATTTVTRTHEVGWRAIGHALARSPYGTYMYRFRVHMYRYWGRGADAGAQARATEHAPAPYDKLYRPRTSAPAQHVWCTYVYQFAVHMYCYGWTRCKRRRAGTSNETCFGTYFNQHRPLASAPAQRCNGFKL